MEEPRKIVMYAIAENGNGRVKEIGRYDSIEEIEVVIRMFAKDVIISLEYATDSE